ncbi:MAG TPA: ABC transporter ATP-binding protein, partial [Chloroflexi bacterium]|nr:ABC transporter ATP-binding protein [Chloroflexota bacterium]
MVSHLTKRFGDRVAFEDVSFEVARGEVFGFL